MAHDEVDEAGLWKQKLQPQSLELFELLPAAIQEQLMLERDPHGNVQVLIGFTAAVCQSAYLCYDGHLSYGCYMDAGCKNRNRENVHSNG